MNQRFKYADQHLKNVESLHITGLKDDVKALQQDLKVWPQQQTTAGSTGTSATKKSATEGGLYKSLPVYDGNVAM